MFSLTRKPTPEMAGLSPAECRQIWRAAWKRAHGHWHVWVTMAVAYAGIFYGNLLGIDLGYPQTGASIGALLGSMPYLYLVNSRLPAFIPALVAEFKAKAAQAPAPPSGAE
jgi:hypothetical protein